MRVTVYAAETWYSTHIRRWANSRRSGGPADKLSLSLSVLRGPSWRLQVQGIVEPWTQPLNTA